MMAQKAFDTTSQNLLYKRSHRLITTGISDIDQFIKQNQNNYLQNQQNNSVKQSIVHSGGIIEIYGSSGTGKTETAMEILANAVLPPHMGGNEIGVIYFDNDYKFDIFRFRQIILVKYKQFKLQKEPQQPQQTLNVNEPVTINDDDTIEFDHLFQECLSRVYIVRCKDSYNFFITLSNINQLIKNIGNNVNTQLKGTKEIYLMIIDSISAFYWLDQKGEALAVRPNLMWIDPIRKLINEFSLLIITTKQAIYNPNNSNIYNNNNDPPQSPIIHKEFLSNDYTKLVRYRKCLSNIK